MTSEYELDNLKYGKAQIKARPMTNHVCLKCGKTPQLTFVRVGAFDMCNECFHYEFTDTSFDPDSQDGKTYYKWLKVYKAEI